MQYMRQEQLNNDFYHRFDIHTAEIRELQEQLNKMVNLQQNLSKLMSLLAELLDVEDESI